MDINETYLKLSDAVYGIQLGEDHNNAIDRAIWQQLPINVMMGDGSNLQTTTDSDGYNYYSTSSGLQAAVYRNSNTGEISIAYRGTDSMVDIFSADPENQNIDLSKIPTSISSINSAFTDFMRASAADGIVNDPIILDLNGDGVKTTTVANGVYFDYGADGFAESTAWADSNDGVLVVDTNGNGKIDDKSELVTSTDTPRYFTEGGGIVTLTTTNNPGLSDYDTNKDGIVDINDTNFADLKILKGNGTLQSLSDAGIASINLPTSTNKTIDDKIYEFKQNLKGCA